MLSLGTAASVPVRGGPRGKAAKTGRTGSSTMAAAARDRWAGWHEYRAKHPNAKPKQFFQAKKAEGVKKSAVGVYLVRVKHVNKSQDH